MKLDEFDQKIIDALQKNGRLSNMELAEQVKLSHSSCSRRISRLEKEGYIVGYRALTNRRKLGLSVRAFCNIKRVPGVPWKEVACRLAENPLIISVFAVSGDSDIMIEIVAEDMQHFSDVVLKDVADTEGVLATVSTFVMDEVKSLY